jgi:membrane protein implicated in regulation of membrane protease activity
MVVLVVAILLAVFVLPPSWGALLVISVLVWEFAEKALWLRLIRRYPVAVGPEVLIGQPVTASTVCQPEGRVRLRGETWKARCASGAQPGETLVVEGVERITLIVGKPGS